VHGDYGLRLQQIAGVRRFPGRHHKAVTDGKQGDLRRVQFTNDRHIAEHGSVACVINLQATGEFDYIPASLAAVHNLIAVGDSAGVIGVNHGDFNIAHGLRSAFVHGSSSLGAFFLHPATEFEDPHHDRIVLLYDLDRVPDVVKVTVRAEQNVDLLDSLVGLGTHGIAHDPGVDDDGLTAGGLDAERRVSQPGEFNAFEIHECQSSLVRLFRNRRFAPAWAAMDCAPR
jgi:hypothetical protein